MKQTRCLLYILSRMRLSSPILYLFFVPLFFFSSSCCCFLHPGHSLTQSWCFLLIWSLLCSLAPISYSPEASFCQACILCQLNAAKTKLAALAFCIPEAPRALLDYLQPFRVEKPNVSPDPLSPPLRCSQLRRQTAPLGSNFGMATPSKRSMTQQALTKPVGMHSSLLMRTDADIGPSNSNSSSTAATKSHGADIDRNCTSKQADNMHASAGRRQGSNAKTPQKARQPSQPVSSPKTPDICDVLASLKANKAVPSCDAHSACNADPTGKALAADATLPPTASTYTKATVLASVAAAEVDKAHSAANPAVGSSARQAGKAKKYTKSTSTDTKSTSADRAYASDHDNSANTAVRTALKPSQSALAGQASDAADAFAAPGLISAATKAETLKEQPECTDQSSVSSSVSAAAEPSQFIFTGKASHPAAFSALDTVSNANPVGETAGRSACTDKSVNANASIRPKANKQAHKGKPSASRKTNASAA